MTILNILNRKIRALCFAARNFRILSVQCFGVGSCSEPFLRILGASVLVLGDCMMKHVGLKSLPGYLFLIKR